MPTRSPAAWSVRRGYALLIAASLADGPQNLVASVAGRVDGFAVLARTIATEELEVLARRLPVVMIAGPREIDHLDHVEVANADGVRELTTHLTEDHGLRSLVFVGGPADSPDAHTRFLGFQRALDAARLPVPSEPAVRGDFTQAGGRAATRYLVDHGPLPRALVFANDQMAVGAYDVLERRGVRVPRDVAVVGFDGIPLGRVVRPGLTTVTQPMRLLGETAADLLVDRLTRPTRAPCGTAASTTCRSTSSRPTPTATPRSTCGR